MERVDVSVVALDYAADSASLAGLAGKIHFEEHDLAETFPEGSFELVVISFLQSPQDWPRTRVLARAAGAVSTGGHLLISEHTSHPPESGLTEDTIFPTAEETLASLALGPRQWRRLCVCPSHHLCPVRDLDPCQNGYALLGRHLAADPDAVPIRPVAPSTLPMPPTG